MNVQMTRFPKALCLLGAVVAMFQCGSVQAQDLPDLVVDQISWAPQNPAPGDAVTFGATIRNQGTAATPLEGFPVISIAFSVDGVLSNWSNNLSPWLVPSAISIQTANGGVDGTSTWLATAGLHTIEAWVDDANRIVESDENNNKLTATLDVGGAPAPADLPDLIVTDVNWNPSNPSVGDAVIFGATIQNQGAAATPNSFPVVTIAFSVDGVIVNWSDNLSPFLIPGGVSIQAANSGINGVSTWSVTVGTHEVEAWVDYTNTILESDENNNKLSATLEVEAPPVMNQPPVVTAAFPSVAVLWSPNHKLVPVQILGVTDPDGDTVQIRVTAVKQDEKVDGHGDGHTSPDAIIQDDGSVLLRAERSEHGDGRVYHIEFTVDDGRGGISTGEVKVSVPSSKKKPAKDGGALFDSTQKIHHHHGHHHHG